MDVKDRLQAYTAQIVALGQATLAHYRRGESLPAELDGLAADLLALEDAMRAPAAAASQTPPPATAETVAPDEPPVTEPALVDDWLPTDASLSDIVPADQAAWAEPSPTEATAILSEDSAPYEPGAIDFAVMTPVEADDWLAQFSEPASGVLVVTGDAAAGTVAEQPLVIDVEETGDDPAMIASPVEEMSPLAIDADSLSAEEAPWLNAVAAEPVAAEPAAAEPAAAEPVAAEPVAAPPAAQPDELQFCTNCGAPLRPGRRFCYRCGASLAEMTAEALAPAAPELAGRPSTAPVLSGPPSEWPTVIGDMPNFEDIPTTPPASAPAGTRFCNNCGLGVDASVTVCPECGSRDIA